MLEKYKVVKEKNEDVLYLYLSMNYEFAKDLDDYNLDNLDKDWLINQRLQFLRIIDFKYFWLKITSSKAVI